MKKYIIVLKVKNFLTGEVKMVDWMIYNREPTQQDILDVKSDYNDAFQDKYNERVEYAKVSCVYV